MYRYSGLERSEAGGDLISGQIVLGRQNRTRGGKWAPNKTYGILVLWYAAMNYYFEK